MPIINRIQFDSSVRGNCMLYFSAFCFSSKPNICTQSVANGSLKHLSLLLVCFCYTIDFGSLKHTTLMIYSQRKTQCSLNQFYHSVREIRYALDDTVTNDLLKMVPSFSQPPPQSQSSIYLQMFYETGSFECRRKRFNANFTTKEKKIK